MELDQIIYYFTQLPFIELIAVILALLYVILAAQGNSWCWPAAFISTAIYTVIFYDVALLMDSVLNVYYMFMALYGWYCWQKKTKISTTISLEVCSWSWLVHSKIIALLTLISIVVGYFMATHTHAAFPYLDSATTVFAIFATYLVTKKVLENWLYWLAIDFVSIYLYVEKALQPTAVLFAIYIVIALYGYFQWLKQYKSRVNTQNSLLVGLS